MTAAKLTEPFKRALWRRDGSAYEYICDGMPTLRGCGEEIRTTRPYSVANNRRKPSGWLVCYGQNEDGTDDKDIVLTFCPRCAEVVEAQMDRKWGQA